MVIHVESPDEEGHAGSASGKIAAIEAIDREIVKAVRACTEELSILAMPDHPTPTALKTHVGEPVPFIVWGPGIEHNGAPSYGESAASATGLVLDPGRACHGRAARLEQHYRAAQIFPASTLPSDSALSHSQISSSGLTHVPETASDPIVRIPPEPSDLRSSRIGPVL